MTVAPRIYPSLCFFEKRLSNNAYQILRHNTYQLLCPIAYQLLSYLAQYSLYLCINKNYSSGTITMLSNESIRHEEINSTGTKGFIAFLKNMHVLLCPGPTSDPHIPAPSTNKISI